MVDETKIQASKRCSTVCQRCTVAGEEKEMSKTLQAVYREIRTSSGDDKKIEIKCDTNEGQIILQFNKTLFLMYSADDIRKVSEGRK